AARHLPRRGSARRSRRPHRRRHRFRAEEVRRMTRLSETPYIHPSAQVTDSTLGRYTEVGSGCRVAHSTLGDYSYCVENTQIAYATIGKFSNIAAHVRIYASMHPHQRASLHHFTYRSAWYFDDAQDDQDFFEWRASTPISIGHDTWIGH